MKIAHYSDLHLEFYPEWSLPSDLDVDVIILAGDVLVFHDYDPLLYTFESWEKPILFCAGNHEYYTWRDIEFEKDAFRTWAYKNMPQLVFLDNQSITIDEVSFFGGTMWTDFYKSNPIAMEVAKKSMVDYKRIFKNGRCITPTDTVDMHASFKESFMKWKNETPGTKVVFTHCAPVPNPDSPYYGGKLEPAFVCTDMFELMDEIDLWVYGHTHIADDRIIGKTKISSNPLGYPIEQLSYEYFDHYGKVYDLYKMSLTFGV